MTKIMKLFVILSMLMGGAMATGCTKPYIKVATPRPTTAPPEGQARIYFSKPGGSMGKAYTMILEDDKVIGYLQNRTVFYKDVPAGEHFFMSVSSNTEGLQANLASGKTYYVRIYSHPGAMSMLGGGSEDMRLEPLGPGAEGWEKRYEWVDGPTLIEVNPEYAAKWEAKYAAKNAERLAKFKSGEAQAQTIGPEQGE